MDVPDEPRPFRYDGEVAPGEKRHLRGDVHTCRGSIRSTYVVPVVKRTDSARS